jgi:adenylosuccinate synthase
MAGRFEGYHGNTALVGVSYGDEGKGKVSDLLAPIHDMGGKGNGSNNAGHTFTRNGVEVNAHQLPSTVNEGKLSILGPGVFLNPVALVKEIAEMHAAGIEVTPDNLAISDRAHFTLPRHVALDELAEGGGKSQGTTKSGVRFVAGDKGLREGLRGCELIVLDTPQLKSLAYEGLRAWVLTDGHDLSAARRLVGKQIDARERSENFASAVDALKPYITDTVSLLHERLEEGETILLEGAQAYGLDINYGKYPFNTSSDTTVSGLLSGMGMGFGQLNKAIGVAKALPSKVGKGPFVTRETDPAIEDSLRGQRGAVDGEYGKSTGRPREVGYLDLVQLKEAVRVNGFSEIALNKLDALERCEDEIKVAGAYDLDGKIIEDSVPARADDLARCEPVYVAYAPVPEGSIRGVKDYDKLPGSIKDMVGFIERKVGVAVTILGTGPNREDTIIK